MGDPHLHWQPYCPLWSSLGALLSMPLFCLAYPTKFLLGLIPDSGCMLIRFILLLNSLHTHFKCSLNILNASVT